MDNNKIFIFDSLAYIYRYYNIIGINNVATANKATAIVNSYIANIKSILLLGKATHVAVVFDIKKPTFRHSLYTNYKANRKGMPPIVANAVTLAKSCLLKLGVTPFELEGFEADDIIGTLANAFSDRGFMVYIVSPDKDFLQLVTDNIVVFRDKKPGKPPRIIDKKAVCNLYGVKNPAQLTDVFALAGDTSDNIKPVSGFSKRVVNRLLSEFGSIDCAYQNIDNANAKLKKLLIDKMDSILLNKKLVTIDVNVPISFNADDLLISNLFSMNELS